MATLNNNDLQSLDTIQNGLPFNSINLIGSSYNLDIVDKGLPYLGTYPYVATSLLPDSSSLTALDVLYMGLPFVDIEAKSLNGRSLDISFKGLPLSTTYLNSAGYAQADVGAFYKINTSVTKDLVSTFTTNLQPPASIPSIVSSVVSGLFTTVTWTSISGTEYYEVELRHKP